MPLPQLVPGQPRVDVQHTAFTADALARHLCSTWEEATGNGGPAFTAVVVGAGMYGAYCATRLYRENPNARVLLLDAGPFLVGEHVQNLGPVGLDVPGAITPSDDPGAARALVWGLAWRGNVQFPGLAYCAGGKSLYWGGWCPRLTVADLAGWPAAAAQGLLDTYSRVEGETGVVPATDFISASCSTGSSTGSRPWSAVCRNSTRSRRNVGHEGVAAHERRRERVRGIGEMVGDRLTPVPHPEKSWINPRLVVRGAEAPVPLLELRELLGRDAGQAAGQLGVVEIDQPDPGQQLQARLNTRARGRLRHDGGPLPR